MATVVLPYTFADGVNMPASGAEVMANFNAILAQVNGNLQAANRLARGVIATDIANALAEQVAVPNGSITPRGHSINEGSESLSTATPSVMPTPDRVTIDVPTTGLVKLVAYCEMAGFANGVVPHAALYLDGALIGAAIGSFTVGSPFTAGTYFPVKAADPSFSVGLVVGPAVVSGPLGVELPMFLTAGSHVFEWRFYTTGSQQMNAQHRYLFVKAEKY